MTKRRSLPRAGRWNPFAARARASWTPPRSNRVLLYFALKAAEYEGDYGLALRNRNALVPVSGLINAAGNTAGGAIDAALAHDPVLARARLAELTPADLAFNIESSTVAGAADYARGLAAAEEEDWRAASSYFERSEDEAQHVAQASNESFNGRYLIAVLDGPWLAFPTRNWAGRQKRMPFSRPWRPIVTCATGCAAASPQRGRTGMAPPGGSASDR